MDRISLSDNRISESELLRYAADNGILNLKAVTQQLEMAKKRRFLEIIIAASGNQAMGILKQDYRKGMVLTS